MYMSSTGLGSHYDRAQTRNRTLLGGIVALPARLCELTSSVELLGHADAHYDLAAYALVISL